MTAGPLTVLYDGHCSICRAARNWLARQPQWVELRFLAAASPAAARAYPELDAEATLREIHVVDTGGQVYRGAKAWLMCLWALEHYRATSLTFADPARQHLAERFVKWVARNRPRDTAPSRSASGTENGPYLPGRPLDPGAHGG